MSTAQANFARKDTRPGDEGGVLIDNRDLRELTKGLLMFVLNKVSSSIGT